jgi:selenocysteine lyase/cysteine desulfurase
MYRAEVPDNPGGGTVDWNSPRRRYKSVDDIEAREDGGTPAFLQTIRTSLAIRLKEEMGVENIRKREEEMLEHIWLAFDSIPNLHVLAGNVRERLGVISFVIEKLHYNLVAKLLNDRFGVQVRGGCSCAGTYGHYLLNLDQDVSEAIIAKIDSGDLSLKPGWVRMSIHPTMTNEELDYVLDSIRQVAENGLQWAEDYKYNPSDNEFYYRKEERIAPDLVDAWFSRSLA